MAVALAALIAAVASGAYATGKSSSSTISACVHHHGGGLYRARKCKRHDKRLTWNVTGPQGATGATGPSTGAAGGDLTGSYPNPTIANGAITTEKLAAGAVATANIAPGAVGTARIADGAVTGAKVGAGTLRLANIAVWSAVAGTGGGSVFANGCSLFSFGDVSGATPTDLVIGQNATPSMPIPEGLIATGSIQNSSGHLVGGYCNLTGSTIAVPSGSSLRFYGIR